MKHYVILGPDDAPFDPAWGKSSTQAEDGRSVWGLWETQVTDETLADAMARGYEVVERERVTDDPDDPKPDCGEKWKQRVGWSDKPSTLVAARADG